MARRLVDNITTDYLGAAQRLKSRYGRRKIVVYVEGYDDIMFWRSLLGELETEKFYFEVMLPSRTSLLRGKKSALMNTLGRGLGQNMIACVDADYDYLLQGSNDISNMICNNPYVFHTYAYAIENYECYAPSLHNVCVMATLNDHVIFDFEAYMMAFSKIAFPLLIWSVWCYQNGYGNLFTLADLSQVITMTGINLQNPNSSLARLTRKVNVKVSWLQRRFPQAKGPYQRLKDKFKELGVTPESAYLYFRGHDIFDKVVSPLIEDVCLSLRKEREREIRRLANHSTQRSNELSGYQHAMGNPVEMLRKHTDYRVSPLYKRIQQDIRDFLEHIDEPRLNAPVLTPWEKNKPFKN